nr:hypothetical protein [Tanacetum cinerariifolium]
SSVIISSKIDSLFDEFAGKLTLLKSIPPEIDETDCHPKKEIRFAKRLLYDNSSPRPPGEIVSDNSNADIESFSPSPIPNEDSDSHMEEIDLSFNPDDPMPSGIEEDDDDSKRDIPILEELLDNYSLSLPTNELYHFDIPSPYRPPAKPPDGNTGTLNIKMIGDVSDQKVSIPNLTITRVLNQEKSPDLLSHLGLESFQPSAECPMIINGKNTPLLDNSFDCPPDSYHPPHPTYETYSGDSCGNDSHSGYDCPHQFPLNYEPEPGYIQNYNSYPHDSPSFLQQYPCCEDCGVTHEPYQCQPKNHDYYHKQNSCCDSNSIGFDQSQPQQYTVNHPIFNAHHDLLGSQKKLNITLTKIDSLFDEFTGKLTLLKSIPPGIDETDCHHEKETRFPKRLFDPHMKEIDLPFTPDDPMPPGIEDDDYDSVRDIPILEELLDTYSLSLPANESYHFDIPSLYRPPAKPPDGNTGTLNIKMLGDVSDQKVPIPNLTITRVLNQEKSPDLLSHLGFEAFQPSAECPMIINRKNIPLLDVLLFHFYPP